MNDLAVVEVFDRRYEDALAQASANIAEELVLENRWTAKDRVLDLGSGSGLHWEKVRPKPTVVGLDVSYAQCRKAMVASKIKPMQADLTDPLPLSQAFTHVFTHATLHWVSNWPSLLKEVRRILSQEGEFIGSVSGKQNLAELLARLGEVATPLGFAKPNPYCQLTSVTEFNGLLEEAGFQAHSVKERFVEPCRESVSPKNFVAAMAPLLFGNKETTVTAVRSTLSGLADVPIRYHQIIFRAGIAVAKS